MTYLRDTYWIKILIRLNMRSQVIFCLLQVSIIQFKEIPFPHLSVFYFAFYFVEAFAFWKMIEQQSPVWKRLAFYICTYNTTNIFLRRLRRDRSREWYVFLHLAERLHWFSGIWPQSKNDRRKRAYLKCPLDSFSN